ncbi:glycosyltransferase family 4 protein [Patescibacteria group bacterium]|nr:glycosyltransferase family 4 protein [Patescibacteria group bacterium]
MRIAHIAPIYLSVPPAKRGGTERIVFDLVEEQVRAGHEVTLFSVKTSKTSAKLEYLFNKPFTQEKDFQEWTSRREINLTLAHIEKALSKEDNFDVFHFHFDDFVPQFSPFIKKPILTTFHYVIDQKVYNLFRQRYQNYFPIALSHNQIKGLEGFSAVVPNGLNLNEIPFKDTKEDFLITAGRIVPDKGIKESIDIAKSLQEDLVIIGHVNPRVKRSVQYYEEHLAKDIDNQHIKHLDGLSHQELLEYFSRAKAFVFPLQWEEPFGLVVIEAMACGTPVVALDRGAMREIIKDKSTGFLCQNVEEMKEALKKIDQIDPQACRQHVQDNFSISRVSKLYIEAYQHAINS